MRYGGIYYAYDRRLITMTNTPEQPGAANVSAQLASYSCPNVAKNPFNRDKCVIAQGCAPLQFSSQPVVLNHTMLRLMYTAGRASPRLDPSASRSGCAAHPAVRVCRDMPAQSRTCTPSTSCESG